MMTLPAASDLIAKLEIALPALTDEDRLLARTSVRELANGHPVDIEALAAALSKSPVEVDDELAKLPWVVRDSENRVILYGGATLIETPHRLRVDDRDLYAMCAGDALILPFLFDGGARVRSTCPTTKEPVGLTVLSTGVTELTPPGAVMTYPHPGESGFSFTGDLVSNLCSFSHFFTSQEAAKAWAAKHEGAFPLSIDDGFTLAQWWAARLFGLGEAPVIGREGSDG